MEIISTYKFIDYVVAKECDVRCLKANTIIQLRYLFGLLRELKEFEKCYASPSLQISVTKLGEFLNFFVTNFLKKKPKCMVTFWAKVKSSFYCIYFWGNFWKNLGYFYFQRLVTLLQMFVYSVIVILFTPEIFLSIEETPLRKMI